MHSIMITILLFYSCTEDRVIAESKYLQESIAEVGNVFQEFE